ncbi:MAG: helix-turn-helix domain containing protein [Candidatus Moranbacteria bacterium]|nr:helix-turn-helix domain containing protein [Candidatus Moranbacteria bacterium]
MIKKNQEKLNAIALRKQGLSYSEILKKVDVSKSTLSLWLREIGLAKQQKQRLTEKRKLAQKKAQETCRNNRIKKQDNIIELAKKDIDKMNQRDFLIAGSLLYWAEGAKQKTNNVSQRVSFCNSDPQMIILFNRWVKEICNIKLENISYCIYIHRTADHEKARKFWENILNIKIEKIYFKNHNPKTNRKNIGNDYNGMLRIDVQRSTDLNRKIKGWILGIIDNLK